jgi:hypothetical protein
MASLGGSVTAGGAAKPFIVVDAVAADWIVPMSTVVLAQTSGRSFGAPVAAGERGERYRRRAVATSAPWPGCVVGGASAGSGGGQLLGGAARSLAALLLPRAAVSDHPV